MTNVNLTIGGRPYTVSAPDGEESHIEMLGRMVGERVAQGGGGPAQSETRMLLFAALMLADEPAADVLARIESLAARVEKLAAHLEEPAT